MKFALKALLPPFVLWVICIVYSGLHPRVTWIIPIGLFSMAWGAGALLVTIAFLLMRAVNRAKIQDQQRHLYRCTMPDLDNTIRRLASLGKAQDKAFSASAAAVPSAARNLSMSFAIGSRVLDLITGVEGTVIHGQRENVIIPPARNGGG